MYTHIPNLYNIGSYVFFNFVKKFIFINDDVVTSTQIGALERNYDQQTDMRVHKEDYFQKGLAVFKRCLTFF